MKVLMAAPFEVKGRYQGGISSIVNALIENPDCLKENDLEIIKYETCRVERSEKSDERLDVSNLKNCIAIYSSLWREIKTENPQVLYYHSSVRFALLKDLLAIRHAKKKTGIKIIVHIHFAEYEKIMTGIKVLDDVILNILKKYVDKVVFLSKNTAEEFAAHGLDRSKTVVIYNFSTVEYTHDEQEKALLSENEICKFLFVGSVDKRKGVCDILDCLKQINEPFEFHICGGYRDDDVKLEVKNAIQQMGASIIEHGYVSGENKKNIYLNSDVLLLPSYGEGLPMVIMEAYHAGCAVIASSVGAIPEIVGKGNGFVIEPGNKEQLLNAMNTLIKDRQLLQKMKKENLQTAGRFTLRKFVFDIAAVCKELV